MKIANINDSILNIFQESNMAFKLYSYIKFNRVFIVLLLACTMFSGGCVTHSKYFKKADYDIDLVHRIAVLPFGNHTLDRYSGEKMKEKVVIELLLKGYEIIEEGEITRMLVDLKVQSAAELTLNEIRALGEVLKVDAVIKGAVSSMDIVKGASIHYPEAALTLRMIDIKSGETVWSVSNSGGGPGFLTRHFGTEGKTLDEVARKVVKEAVNTLQ